MIGESDSLMISSTLPFLRVTLDRGRYISASGSRVEPSNVWTGSHELCVGGIGTRIEGTGGACVGIEERGETSVSCDHEIVNGLIKENASEILESLHSTGDLIAMMLVGEGGTLPKETGDGGAEDTRLSALSCGKTDIPHLLVGRTGSGVSSGGVTGGLGSGGRVGGGTIVLGGF